MRIAVVNASLSESSSPTAPNRRIAEAVIAVTPTRQASYSGLLKRLH